MLPMPLRFFVGILKGLVLGGLLGFGLAYVGMGLPPAWLAYVAAALTGAMIAAVAGKPIWAKGARIEVGMKAVAALVLAPILLLLVRSFADFGLPVDALKWLPHADLLANATFGTLGVTALGGVAAALGGFYEADNQPGAAAPEVTEKKGTRRVKLDAAKKKKRIELMKITGLSEAEIEAAEERDENAAGG